MIYQMEPWFGKEEQEAIAHYMNSEGWITEFKQTETFEKMIAEYTSAKHCIVVNNGTISLTLIALACEIGVGDQVIVPNFTMIATPNSVKILGAEPVFVDVEPETLCMDYDCMVNSVTPHTKAVYFVNANGRNPKTPIEKYVEFCNDNGILFIEDSAQSLGSFHTNGRHQGTVGLAGSFSFSAPKIISTGQGGAIVTNDDNLSYRVRRLKDFGRAKGGIDIHDTIGFNFKFTELQAIIGIEQMKKLAWRVNRKKEIYRLYQALLSDLDTVKFFEQNLEYTTPWFIDILAEYRNELADFLNKKGIGTRFMYPPINQQTAYNVPGSFPVSELVGQKGLWLPSANQLTNDQIEFICNEIVSFYQTKSI